MAKRLTDSSKWDDPWFMDLPNEYKLAWLFILDRCDHAGIWKVNLKIMNFCIGHTIKADCFLTACNDRIILLGEDKWFIPKFISYQYGTFSDRCNAHKPVLSVLKKHGLEGYFIPTLSLPGREQRQEQELDQEKEGIVKGSRKPSLEEVTAEFTAKGFTAEALRFHSYYESVGWVVGKSRKPMKNWRGAVATWLANRKEWDENHPAQQKKQRDLVFKKDQSCQCCKGTGYMTVCPGVKCQFCWK